MKQVEYIGEVLENGQLSLPEGVRLQLGLLPRSRVRVILGMPEIGAITDVDASRAWEVFEQMGRDAPPGRLMDSSINHDKYLYHKQE